MVKEIIQPAPWEKEFQDFLESKDIGIVGIMFYRGKPQNDKRFATVINRVTAIQASMAIAQLCATLCEIHGSPVSAQLGFEIARNTVLEAVKEAKDLGGNDLSAITYYDEVDKNGAVIITAGNVGEIQRDMPDSTDLPN